MPAIPYLERADASPKAIEMYDKGEGRFEMLLNIFKVWGHAPELMDPFMDFIMQVP